MTKEFESRAAGAAAPLDQVRQSVYSDLQYVSLEVDGRIYGGWYRQLTDGRLELLALANMHSERRTESTPIEQARGMLADFVRSARQDGLTGDDARAISMSTRDGEGSKAQSTLGDLLYADTTKVRVPEEDWVGLVRSIAAGDQQALDLLFERTHRIVFTLMMRLIGNREAAEELTLDVFYDVWRQAACFDAAGGPVLAWLLNQARLRALERLELEHRRESEVSEAQQRAGRLRNAVTALSIDERQLIEAAYFSKVTYHELAGHQKQPPEAVRRHIHVAMEKLRDKLRTGAEGP